MRDYSNITDEALEKIIFKHYTDEELIEKINKSKQQIKDGKYREFNKSVLDEMFNRHALQNCNY